MDIFEQFSGDICLRLLESFDEVDEARVLARASPVMSRYFCKYKTSICRTYLRRNLDDDLIQDALGIITFPRDALRAETSLQDRTALTGAHLRVWGAKAFPDPTKAVTFDAARILELESLYSHIWVFIHDYLTKATCVSLPVAYGRRPHRVEPGMPLSAVQDETGQEQTGPDQILAAGLYTFDRKCLTSEELRRILRAFLRYELLCLVYGPSRDYARPEDEEEDGYRDIGNYELFAWDPDCRFPPWDYQVLSQYEEAVSEESDLQLLACVRQYVFTTYLSSIFETWHMGWHPRYDFEFCPNKASHFASAGFDILTEALTHGPKWCRVSPRGADLERRRYVPYDIYDMPGPVQLPGDWINGDGSCSVSLLRQRLRAWPLFTDEERRPRLKLTIEMGAPYCDEHDIEDYNLVDMYIDILGGGSLITASEPNNTVTRFWTRPPLTA